MNMANIEEQEKIGTALESILITIRNNFLFFTT